MKKFLFLWLLIPVWVSAQNRQIVEATAGEDLTQVVSTQFQYVFPEFTGGDVFYAGMPKVSGILNYNTLLGEMQFLDQNGQVLSLANVKDVTMVNIGNRRFFPFKGNEFTEELMSTGKVQLRVKRSGNAAQHSKKGAYGTTSATSSITSYSSISSDSRQYNLTVAENVLVTLNNFYYLVELNNKHILIKNITAFTKMFPTHRAEIEAFAKENNIRLNNGDDLKALLEFCGKLN